MFFLLVPLCLLYLPIKVCKNFCENFSKNSEKHFAKVYNFADFNNLQMFLGDRL